MVKKIGAIVCLILFLVVAGWLIYEQCNTTKQVYEGVLVFNQDNVSSSTVA